MPDQYGNPTFKDIFDNPEVFKQLYNAYVPATAYSLGGAPSQPATFQAQPPAKVPVPSTSQTGWDALRNAMLVASGNLTDTARIYQGAPVEGLGARAITQQQAAQQEREDSAQKAMAFNAQQENQFGTLAQKNAFAATQQALKQMDITARGQAKIDSQTEEARNNRLAADARAQADRQARIDLENQRFEHEKTLTNMKLAQRAAEDKAKGTPGQEKVAAQYADTAARIDMARKQLDVMKTHYESALGITPESKGQPTKSRGVGGFVGAELMNHPNAAYIAGYLGQGGKDAQLHETYRDSLATTLAPLLSGSKRAVIGIIQAIRPTLPGFRDEPTVAAEKYKNMNMLIDISGNLPGATPEQRAAARAALREKIISFATDPNIKAQMQLEFSKADASLDPGEIASAPVGQRVPSPPPPKLGTKKSPKDVMDDIFR